MNSITSALLSLPLSSLSFSLLLKTILPNLLTIILATKLVTRAKVVLFEEVALLNITPLVEVAVEAHQPHVNNNSNNSSQVLL